MSKWVYFEGMQATVAKPREARYHGMAVTREEYLDLEDDGFLYDMVGGRLLVAPSHAFEHGSVQAAFVAQLHNYLRKHPVGEVTVETDVLLPDGGDVVRPDISLVLHENIHRIKKHIHGAPDFIAEVLSPSTRERDLGEKSDRYLKTGVKEYWIVDLENEQLELRVNRGHEWEVHFSTKLKSNLLSGFVVKQRDLF